MSEGISNDTLRALHACLMELPRSAIREITARALKADVDFGKRKLFCNRMDVCFYKYEF